MTIEQGDAWLNQLKNQMEEDIKADAAPRTEKMTVRQFIGRFGYSRRGSYLVGHIRDLLEKLELRTNPDFEYAYLDGAISVEMQSSDGVEGTGRPDPTPRIEMLDAAHRVPKSVKPDDPISKATTIMQVYDYSQLPVMSGKFTVKGTVTWQSIAAQRAHNKRCEFVRDCMETPQVAPISAPLFDVIATVIQHGYVLVQGRDKVISGIVTSSDLSDQFRVMAGPFIFIREIEEHLRHLVHRKFEPDVLRAAAHPPEREDRIKGTDDLTFAEYCNLLGQDKNWKKINLKVNHSEFMDCLRKVNDIRNDVMHFRPEGLSQENVQMLRDVARFFESRLD